MRYRLRTLLIVVTVACVLLAWVSYAREVSKHHRREAETIWHQLPPYIIVPTVKYRDELDSLDEHCRMANKYDRAAFRPWELLLAPHEP